MAALGVNWEVAVVVGVLDELLLATDVGVLCVEVSLLSEKKASWIT